MKQEILLIGGGHCNSVIDVIELENKYTIAGIIDDNKKLLNKTILDYKVIICGDDLEKLFSTYKYALITIGQIKSNKPRIKLSLMAKKFGIELIQKILLYRGFIKYMGYKC